VSAEPNTRVPSDLVRLARPIEARAQAAARARIDAATRRRHQVGRTPRPELPHPVVQSSAVAARSVGWSRSTYERAKAVVVAAERDPERFGPIAAEMDRTGRVAGAYDRMRALQVRPPPAAVVRLSRAERTAARRARILALDAAGYTLDQIAHDVGVDPNHVRVVIRVAGGAPSRQRQQVGRIDHDAAVERLVAQAAPPDLVVDAIDWAAVDHARVPDWDARLKAAVDVLHAIRKKLRDRGAHGPEGGAP